MSCCGGSDPFVAQNKSNKKKTGRQRIRHEIPHNPSLFIFGITRDGRDTTGECCHILHHDDDVEQSVGAFCEDVCVCVENIKINLFLFTSL